MIFHRFVEDGLSHFSYILGDEESGDAAVIDPKRDADDYLSWLESQELTLKAVIETHLHADFVSGAHELATIEDVPHYLSAYDKNERYVAEYDHESLEDGDTVQVGNLLFEAVHTPGHTPEHLSYLLYEENTDDPIKLFSGDFLFVNSLGRPDLIGEDEKSRLVNMLYESVHDVKTREWPDDMDVHPAHGSGSLCGAGLSEDPSSEFGDELRNNPYFQYEDRDEFVEAVFEALGDFPPYYPRMKEINGRGAPYVLPVEAPQSLDRNAFKEGLSKEGQNIIIDLRDQKSFAHGHIPGSYSLALSPKINQWGPWILEYDTPIFLVGYSDFGSNEYETAYRSLLRVGLDDVHGYLEGGFQAWETNEEHVQTLRELEPDELDDALRQDQPPLILDVRTEDEFHEGHVPDAWNIMVGQLPDHIQELPQDHDREILTICSSGYRSALAGSILLRAGYETVGHLTGGFPRWESSQNHDKAGTKSENPVN